MKKSSLRILWIATLAVIIGSTMAACPDGGTTDTPQGGGGPIPLSANEWKNGELTSTANKVQYSISVKANTPCCLWWNDSAEGDGFKTGDIKVSAKWSDGTELTIPINGENNGWSSPKIITYIDASNPNSSKTLIITVEPYDSNSFGTYSIVYNTAMTRPPSIATLPTNTTPLVENKWKNGTITGSTIAEWGWYTLSVTSGTTYRFWWDEKDGSGMFTGDVSVTAYYSDGKEVSGTTTAATFTETNTAWTTAKSFTPEKTDKVYFRVRLYSASSSSTTTPGTYAIVYSTSPTKPAMNLDDTITAVELTANTWKHGTIASTADTDWYKISVTSGTTYSFWWSESANNSIHTSNISVTGYKNDQTVLIPEENTAWTTAKTYTPTADGTLYISVKLYTGYFSTATPGTYGIVYSTSTTRPAMDLSKVDFINTEPLTENIWKDGEIASDGEQWYSMGVSAGTYYLWTNDSNGNYTKTGTIDVTGFYRDGSQAFKTYSQWNYSQSFSNSNTNDTVYIKVTPRTSSGSTPAGTYGIACTTSNTRPIIIFDAGGAVTLDVNKWTNGQINTDTVWYKVTVESGKTYRVYWNDSDAGDSTKTGNVSVYAYYSDWKDIGNRSDGWSEPISFTPSANDTVYLRVFPYSYSSTAVNTGTYAIVCTTGSSRPLDTQGINATALTEKQWKTGGITASSTAVYYSFTASAGTYYLWWDDAFQGGTGKTAAVYVSAYDNGGVTLFNRATSGYTNPQTITVSAANAGTMYVLVEQYNTSGTGTTGTFGIVYSTSNTRPIDTQGINATALTADTWKYGQITSTNATDWYSLSVTSGTTYRFWSTYGGVFSAGAQVSGYYSDGSSAFTQTASNPWTTPVQFNPTKNDTVYINVKSDGFSSSVGIYGIVYSSTSTTRPAINVDGAITATPLTVNQWKNDELTSQNRVFWYSFTASAETYYFWADDSYNGSGTMTGDIKVSAYYNDGSNSYFTGEYGAWASSKTISVTSANVGKVYVKVEAFSSSSSGDGTFRVAYNTANTRPQ